MKITKGSILKITGTLVLVSLVLWKVELGRALTAVTRVEPLYYVVALLIFFFIDLLKALRWKILLAEHGLYFGVFKLYKLILYGYSISRVLPSNVGGDVFRIVGLAKEKEGEAVNITASTLTSRFLGLTSLLFLILVTVGFNSLIPLMWRLAILGLALMMLFLASVALFVRVPFLEKVVAKILFFDSLRNMYWKVLNSFHVYKNGKKRILLALLMSVVVQGAGVVNQYIIFRGLGIEVSLVFIFLAVPVTRLLVNLPISMGGAGLKEISLIAMLARVGVAAEEVVAYSLVGYSFLIFLLVFFFAHWIVAKKAGAAGDENHTTLESSE